VAVNVGFVGVVGEVEDEPQAETRTLRATTRRERRFIGPTPFSTDMINRISGSG
jgi:hypothetical protein